MCEANEQVNSLLPLSEDNVRVEFAYDTVVTKLTDLHFESEGQRVTLFESVQRLEKFHVIQIYNLGVAPLRISKADTSEFLVEAKKIFELCSSFCYTQDVSERIPFDYFSKALQFCFPPQPENCLSSTVVSKLLELFQIFQKKNIVHYLIEQRGQQPNTQQVYTRRGSEYFIAELLEIFQARRVQGCITDVIDQTKRIALLDAQEHRTENLEIKSVFLISWIKLLKITEVSNYFAFCLAKDSAADVSPLSHFLYQTTAQQFQTVLAEITLTGGEIHLPTDKERIGLLLKYITHFCQYQDLNVILSSLRLLADLKIDREVLEVVFEKFLFKGKEQDYLYLCNFERRALDLLSNVLPLFPKEIVFKIIQVCEKFFSRGRNDYALCDPTLCELSTIPINTLSPYYCTLCEVLSLFVYGLHIESHCILQNRAETILELFSGLESGRNVKFLIAVIKQLSLCPSAKLTLEFKKFVLRELNDLAKHFKGDKEREVFQEILGILSSSQVYECTQELLSEILSYLKRFIKKDGPKKTIVHPVLRLLYLISTVPISDDRKLKVLKRAKASGSGLFSSTLMLELMTTFFGVEEANDFFDNVHSVFVDEFKEDKDLFENFQKVIHRALSSTSFQIVPKVGILEVARSISTGIFKEEVDSCCLIVLSWALGMSDSEMVELFSEVQRCANEIFHDQNGNDSNPNGQYNIFWAFSLSLHHVVSSAGFSGEEKLILVAKVCNIFRKGLDVMTPWQIMDAIKNLIPYVPWQNAPDSTGSQEKMSLSFNHIVTFLEDSKMMVQLGRIPNNMDRSLYSVLSEINPNSFTKDRLADVYNFIRSQEHLDEGFFHRIYSFLEVGIQTLNSGEDVLGVLQEMEHFLHAIIPDLIPLVMLSYEYLIQNQVCTQKRKVFMGEVIMKWQSSKKAVVLSFLRLPQLLWKAFAGTDCLARRCETIQRMQEILKGASKEVENYCNEKTGHGYDNLSEISFKELEWLIFYSSLPNHDAALAFSLIFRFRDKQLNYLSSFCGKRENVFLQFLSDGTVCIQEVSSDDNMSTLRGAGDESEGSHTRAAKVRSSALTPVSIAQKMIQILRRIRISGEDISEICFSLWDSVFSLCDMGVTTCFDHQCQVTLSSFCRDDYLDFLLSVLEESSSTEVFLFWVKKNWHHLHQCSDIILKSCRKTAGVNRLDQEARLKFHTAIFNILEMMRTRTTSPAQLAPFQLRNNCFRSLETQLRYLSKVLDINWPIEVTLAVLSSSQEQAIKLVEGFQGLFEENREHPEIILTAAFALQLSQAYGPLSADSNKDLLLKINEHIERLRDDPEDVSGLVVLPKWRQMMIAEGFPVQVIDSWCVAFLATPSEDLSSRDIDAIAELNSRSLQLVSSVSQKIKECIFPETGFGVKEGVNESHIRERLRLARLLGEFINVLKQRKPDENRKDALIKDIVVEACDELCKVYLNPLRKRKELYKIRDSMLKALFTEVFGKQQNQVNEPEFAVDSAVEDQSCKEVQRKASPVKKQVSYLHENLPRLVKNAEVYGPLSVLLRRWLSTIAAKPVLAFHTGNVIQKMFSAYTSEEGPTLMELHHIILEYIISLERNQALISQLQVAGYNQKKQNTLDLWSSPSIECPGYLSNKESANRQRLEKKLTKILRCLRNEWKDILQMGLQMGLIGPVKVGEKVIPTEELFSLQASLEDMDEQASAVRPIVRQIGSQIPALEGRVRVLMSQEQRHRARIKKLESEQSSQDGDKGQDEKKTKVSGARGKDKSERFVAVWDNRFLENVKLCSERIPGCYAPNGFHSEKPVLCALSVDNRILTVFREEKIGRREEIENVEVKLFDAGMFVYELHTSGHDYVTDELWAAFYKKLLEEGLVPRIVLSDESPGFDWIKRFVKPEPKLPFPSKWEFHEGIVPLKEDYFDYNPVMTKTASGFVVLMKENVSRFEFKNFKDARTVEEKIKRENTMTGWAIKELAGNGNKLAWIVRGTIKKMVDDEKVTEKTVEDLGGNVEDRQAVLRACQRAFSRYLSEQSVLTRHHDGHVGVRNQSLETTAVDDVTQ
ncbi:uncharacterized protein LOC114962859 [Acropora millepora]|uniref:uncharacterized protein LOC114962859 n=1 Tax=Acropora millepora TaxID=45264 RepID=UPI001CF348E1|nr:uncharacterized protein LOC114962859 [Acropora millepora]